MAHYYGTLRGTGTSTRTGTARTGIAASAQSYAGSLTVTLGPGESCEIRACAGSGTGGRVLWAGPLAQIIGADSLRPERRSK